MHWRGKLIETGEAGFDAKNVQKMLEGLGNWRKLIVPVRLDNKVTGLPT